MKTNRRVSILSALCLLVSTTVAWAQPPSVAAPRPGNVSLDELLDAVAAASGRSFLVDRRTPESIAWVGVDAEDVDYTTLLAVLRSNDLAAVELSGHVNIVPAVGIRQYPLPLVSPDDTGIADDEWVSAVIELQGMTPIPVMKPEITE